MKRFISLFLVIFTLLISGFEAYATAPSNPSRYMSITNIATQTATATWINGNGYGRFVVIAFGSGTPDWPFFETNYQTTGLNSVTLSNVLDYNGVLPDEINAFNTLANAGVTYVVVDKIVGSARTVALSGLDSETPYSVRVYDYNVNLGGITGDFQLTQPNGNPRTFTTLTGINAPVLALGDINGQIANFTITGNNNDNISYRVDVSELADFSTFYDIYNDLDVGTLSAGASEALEVYVSHATTFYIRVRAVLGNEVVQNIENISFTTTDIVAPEITSIAFNENNSILTVVFSEIVTNDDGGLVGPNATDLNIGVADLNITCDDGQTITLSNPATGDGIVYTFDTEITGTSIAGARFAGTETVTLSQLSGAISLYDVNGNAMAFDEDATINPHKARVVLDPANNGIAPFYSFVYIQDAHDADVALDGDGISLQDGEIYTEDVSITKSLTISDEGVLGAATDINGTFFLNTAAKTVSLVGLEFNIVDEAPTAAIAAFNASGSTFNIDGCTINGITTANIGISIEAKNATANNILNIGVNSANTFNGTDGTAISFIATEAGAFGYSAINILQNHFNNTGLSIDFEAVDLTANLPVINLGAGNSNDGTMSIPERYVTSDTDVNTSEFIYPGIAVLDLNDGVAFAAGTAVEYYTIQGAVDAVTALDNGTQTIFLGNGTYTDAVALDKAVSITGNSAPTTLMNNVIEVSGIGAGDYSIQNIGFNALTTNNSVVISATPDANTFEISACSFDFQAGDVAINVTDPTIAGTLSIAATNSANYFSKSFGVNGGDATGTAIAFPNNQITGTVNISGNGFSFNSTNGDRGIYFSSTNTTGVSDGVINITSNTFTPLQAYIVEPPDGYNAVGDAIVFADSTDASANPTFNLSTGSINIFDGNDFQQDGFGIKLLESANSPGTTIAGTLPNTIDINSAADITGSNALSFNIEDIYGASAYSLQNATGDNDLLYPSIDYAISHPAGALVDLMIGEGMYHEDVTIPSASTLEHIYGNNYSGNGCGLFTGFTLTLEKPIAGQTANAYNFNAPIVILNNSNALMANALGLVYPSGTIKIGATTVTADNATVNKPVTITDNAAGGTYSGTLTLAGGGAISINSLDFTGNPAINVDLASGNTGSITINNNIFTMPDGPATNYETYSKGIVVETGNATVAGLFPLNIIGNTFNSIGGATIAVAFRNQTEGFATFNAVNVNNSNIFNNLGYSIYKVNEGSICTYLPEINVNDGTGNTYSINNTIFGFNYTPFPIDETTTAITSDCSLPLAVDLGEVISVTGAVENTTGTSMAYFNLYNTGIRVQVQVPDDASLINGHIQIQIAKDDGSLDWENIPNSGISLIDAVNTNKIIVILEADLALTTQFAEDVTSVSFRAIAADMAGNTAAAPGAASANTIINDQTVPTVVIPNTVTFDNIINIAEKEAGVTFQGRASEDNVTLYIVNNDITPTPTWTDISTTGFSATLAPTAGVDADVAIAPNAVQIVDPGSYYLYGADYAGNLSAKSATFFGTELSAPDDFTVGTVDVPSENRNGYYNLADHNADRTVTVIVPIIDDPSLVGGTIQVQAKIGVGGTFANVGTPYTITNPDRGNNVTMTLTRAQFEAIAGLAEHDVIYFTAVVSDLYLNPTTGTQSANTLTYDITAPSLVSAVLSTNNPSGTHARNGNEIRMLVTANEACLDNGVTFYSNGTPLNNGSYDPSTPDPLSFYSYVIVEVGGNPADPTGVVTTSTTITDLANNSTVVPADATTLGSVTIDVTAPAPHTAGDVSAKGGNEVANYWNSTNETLYVTIPLAADPSLVGGTIELQASRDGFVAETLEVALPYTIVANDITATEYIFAIPAADFEALGGDFAEGDVWEFRTEIIDIAGNNTTGTKSATTITVDQTAPIVNIDEDGVIETAGADANTLNDLMINIAEKANGFSVNATSNEAASTLYLVNTTEYPDPSNFEIITLSAGFASQASAGAGVTTAIAVPAVKDEIVNANTYQVFAIDAAGNLSAPSVRSLTSDLVQPYVSYLIVHPNAGAGLQNGLKGIGGTVWLQMPTSEPIVVTNSPRIKTNAGPDAYFVYNGVQWAPTEWQAIYTVAAGESTALNSFTLDPALTIDFTNGIIKDVAGNPIVTAMTETQEGQTFDVFYQNNTDITIDGVPPTFTIQYHIGSVVGPSLTENNPRIGIGTTAWILIDSDEQLQEDPTINISGLLAGSPTNNVSGGITGVHDENEFQYSYNRIVYETNDNGTLEQITITATDMAGNTTTVAPTNADIRQAKVDGFRPTPAITFVPDPSNVTTIAVTIDYGEAMQNVTLAKVTVSGGTKSNWVSVGNGVYTFNLVAAGNGSYSVTLPEGIAANQIMDAAGNFAYGATESVIYDNVPPTVSITGHDGAWHNTDVTLTLSATDPGTNPSGVRNLYYTINGDEPTIASTSFAGATTPLVISTDGTNTIKLIADDNATNLTAAGNKAVAVVLLDKTAPVVTNTEIDPLFTVPNTETHWNRGVHTITWVPENLTDATSGLKDNSVTLAYSTNALDVTPTWTEIATGEANDGSYTWTIPAGLNSTDCKIALEISDNANNISGGTSFTFTLDDVAPTAEVSIVPLLDGSLPNGYVINESITEVDIYASFNENMSELPIPVLSINAELAGVIDIANPTISEWLSPTLYQWRFTVPDIDLTKLDNSIAVTVATDLALNPVQVGTVLNPLTGIKVDQVAPTVVSLSTDNDLYNKLSDGTTTEFQVVFSEAMMIANEPGFEIYNINWDLSFAIGAPFSFVSDAWSMSAYTNDTYTATFDVTDDNSTESYRNELVYMNNSAFDLAGNPAQQTTAETEFNIDMVAPSILYLNVISSDGDSWDEFAKVGDIVEIFYATSEDLDDPISYTIRSGGTPVTDTPIWEYDGPAAQYFDYTVNSADAEGLVSFDITISDMYGNTTDITEANITDPPNVTIDKTLPELVIERVAPTIGDAAAFVTNADAVRFTMTFSEPIIDFNYTDIAVNAPDGATFTEINAEDLTGPVVNGTDYVYTLDVLGVAGDGLLGITVNKADFSDRAGNQLANSVTSENFEIDNTAPVIASVEVNCAFTPVNVNINRAITVNFNEEVYSDFHANNDLAGTMASPTDFNVVKTGTGLATINSWNLIAGTGTAGSTSMQVALAWTGTLSGFEEVVVNFQANGVFDQAGNPALGIGDDGIVASTKYANNNNWEYTNRTLTISTQPVDYSVCQGDNALFTASAEGDANTTYGWEVLTTLPGAVWTSINTANLTDPYTFNIDGSELTVNEVTADMDGYQYLYKAINACNPAGITSEIATLNVNPNPTFEFIEEQVTVCETGTITLSVTAYNTATYVWKKAGVALVNGGRISGANTATLTIIDVVAEDAGSYSVALTDANDCETVESNFATVTVDLLPATDLTVNGEATICTGSAATITIVNAVNNVLYELRNGTVVVVGGIGDGTNLELSTDVLTSTTLFNVLAYSTEFCSAQLDQTVLITVEQTPVNPTLATSTPATGTQVCQGSTVSATFDEGTGGSGSDVYYYSLDNGSNWIEYTEGEMLTALTETILISGQRNSSQCTTAASTLATWTVETTPVAKTTTKDPNVAAVCNGDDVRAFFTAASGNGGAGTDTYQYRTSANSGASWTAWSTYNTSIDGDIFGDYINTDGLTNVEIKTTRTTDVCTPATNTVSWTVKPLPIATASNNGPVCFGADVTLSTPDAGEGASYSWLLPDESVVGGREITWTTNNSGILTATVTVTYDGCENTSTTDITVDPAITVQNVLATNNCVGNISVTLLGTENDVTYTVYKNGITTSISQLGTGSAMNINVLNATAGVYTVRANRLRCTDVAMTGTVTVNPTLTAEAGANGATCGTNAYQVTDATATNYASLAWTENGAGSITAGATTLTPTYTPTAADANNDVTLTLTATALAGCTNIIDTKVIHVNPALPALPTVAATNGTIAFCGTAQTTLTASSAGATSYTWYSDAAGTNQIGALAAYNTPVLNATTSYWVKATNDCGSSVLQQVTLTVNTLPSITTTATAQTRCGTGNVTFNAATTSPDGVIDWSLDNFTNVALAGNNELITIVNAGTPVTAYYRARNTVTGCFSATSQVIGTANALPTITINSTDIDNSICEGEAVTLTGNGGTTYTWDNGLGAGASKVVTPAVTTTYTVTGTGANDCQNTAQITITVNTIPEIGTIATAQSRCANGNVTFTSGTASENGVIDWSLDNFATEAQLASNTFTTNVNVGTPITAYYRARNTVTGCTSEISQVVGTANALPTTPTITGNASIAQGQPLTLTTEAGYTSYTWAVNGGIITGGEGTREIIVNWLTTGDKSVTVTVSNASTCTAISLVKTVTVTEACITASITNQPINTSGCQGSTATFTVVAAGTGLSYSWYKVAVPTDQLISTSGATLTIDNIQAANAGTYYVVIDNGCTTDPGVQSNNVALTVTSPSTPTVTIVSNDADNTICPDASVTFTATANNLGGGTVAYQWKLNGNNTGNNQNTYTTTALVNADQVSCTITVSNGCVTSATANSTVITTTVLPVTTITAHPQDVTVAVGSNATFNVTATGNGLTYAWYKSGDVTVLSTTNSLTVSNVQVADNASEYYCIVSGTCGDAVTSDYALLTVILPASQLVITNNITTQESGISFNVIVESRNSNGEATNVTIATPVTITLQTGTGTVSGSGTIAIGTNQVTIPVTYTYINGQVNAVLSANATTLTSGLSNAFNLLPVQPAAPTLTSASVTRNTATINWASGSAVMIFAISGSTDIVTPIVNEGNMDGNTATFNASSVFTSATAGQGVNPGVVNPTAKLLYIGTGSTITITGLSRTTNYVFAIYSYNGTTGTWNFNPNQVQFTYRTSSKDIIEDEDGLITGKFELCKVNPNPVKDVINFCIDAFEEDNYTIELFNANGELVLSQTQLLNTGNHSLTLDLFTQKGGLSAGSYFLKVSSGDETLTQPVIVMP